MMNLMEVNIHQAKNQLSKLIERARNGDEVIIAKVGKPVAKLVPVERRSRREFGSAAGQITFQDGWDAPLTAKEMAEFIGE